MLENTDQHATDLTVSELREAHGGTLLSVSLYGEAASPSYRPGASALSLLVVLEEISQPVLHKMLHLVERWHERRVGTPLFMDPEYIRTSADVFPMEFLDIRDRHYLLVGGLDYFSDIQIDREHLRLQVEEQLRGKMLHLWEAYLETARSHEELGDLVCSSAPGFEQVLRAMLYLKDRDRPSATLDVIGAVEFAFGIALKALTRIELLRQEHRTPTNEEVDSLFADYTAEVRTLVDKADLLCAEDD